MKGLELARLFWTDRVRPAVERAAPELLPLLAAGLMGDGSECYGFDDEISQDHDFGPRVQLFLTGEDYEKHAGVLRGVLRGVPRDFMGYPGVNTSEYGGGREGVFETGEFFLRFIGMRTPPETLRQWRALPEVNLSIASNGAVFYDGPGALTGFREKLLAGWPPELRIKKLAARAMAMAQSGQYNYTRCLRRGEDVAALMAKAEFIESACSMVYIINNRYRPYYKWMHRGLAELPLLGSESRELLRRLAAAPEGREAAGLIEELSGLVIAELRREELTTGTSDFLLDHAPEICARLTDPELRALPVFAD